MTREEECRILSENKKELNTSILNSKRVKITNYLHKHIDLNLIINSIGKIKGIYLAPVSKVHGSNLVNWPFLSTNSSEIFIDEELYIKNNSLAQFQITHEMLHGYFNIQNNMQVYFGQPYENSTHEKSFIEMTGINEACTQMIAEDIEGKRLDSTEDYLYDIKNIMRLMKVIFGEKIIIEQYVYNNHSFEKNFNLNTNNQFNTFKTYMNKIYEYDKKRSRKLLTDEETKYMLEIKNIMFEFLMKLVEKQKQINQHIVIEITNEISDNEFLEKIQILEKENKTKKECDNMNINDLMKILVSNNVIEEIKNNEKLFFELVPELEKCKGFNQNNDWHIYDVYEHTLHVINGIEPNISLRLAALFHDLGKPKKYTEDEFGVGHFKGHWVESQNIFEDFATKYNLEETLKNKVSLLIFYHDKNFENINDNENLEIIKKFNEENIIDLYKLKKADLLAHNPKLHYYQEKYNIQENKILNLLKSRKFCDEVRGLAQKYNLPFFVVTEGASAISNNGCEAVKNARINHEKWELEKGYDPKEDWNKK